MNLIKINKVHKQILNKINPNIIILQKNKIHILKQHKIQINKFQILLAIKTIRLKGKLKKIIKIILHKIKILNRVIIINMHLFIKKIRLIKMLNNNQKQFFVGILRII